MQLLAFSILSHAEVSCLFVFLTAYRPNAPIIEMSATTLAKRARCSRVTAQAATLKLIEVGFITRHSERCFQRDTAAHMFTVNTQPIEPDEQHPRRGYDSYGGNIEQYYSLFPEGEYRARHFRLFHSWLCLPAWLTLSPVARHILFHMYSLYTPSKRTFNYSKNTARNAVGCHNKIAGEALLELFEKGWIAQTVDAKYYLQQNGDGSPNARKNGFKKWKG